MWVIHTLGDATGPQPGEGLVGYLIEEADGGLGCRRFLRLLLFGKEAFVVGYFALGVAHHKVFEVARFHMPTPFGVVANPLK